jgi:hypothetical protein
MVADLSGMDCFNKIERKLKKYYFSKHKQGVKLECQNVEKRIKILCTPKKRQRQIQTLADASLIPPQAAWPF